MSGSWGPGWIQVSNPFATYTGTSPQFTAFLPGWGASLTDSHLAVWSINDNGQAVRNGVADTVTSGIIEMVFCNSNVYVQNGAGNWYVYGGTPGDWPAVNCPFLANFGVSADHTSVNGDGSAITDAAGNVWSITLSAQVAVNGVADTTTSNVTGLAYVSGVLWQVNTSDVWYSKTKPSDSWSPPNGTTTSPLISPAGTTVTPGSGTIYDAAGNTWSVSIGDQVVVNGTTDTTTSKVTQLVYTGGEVWQENSAGIWYGKSSPSAAWSPPNGTTTSPLSVTAGQFSIKNGRFYDPSGNLYIPAGINVGDDEYTYASTNSQAYPIASLFPGINHLRLDSGIISGSYGTTSGNNIMTYPDPSRYLTFVEQLTGYTRNTDGSWSSTSTQHIVVEIEDHDQNRMDPPWTGDALTIQTNWYAALASYYLGNPYVWFGTQNEMNSSDTSYSTSAIAAMSASHAAIYNAIRGTGSKAMLQIMAGIGGSNIGTVGAGAGFVVSDYATMTNICWEIHAYNSNGQTQGNGNVTSASQLVTGGTSAPWSGGGGGWGIAGAQTIQSADGVVPVIFGEWGAGDDGSNPTEMAAAIQSIASIGCGATAWQWSSGSWILVNNAFSDPSSMSLTTYGQTVANVIAAVV